MDLLQPPELIETFWELGYPPYLLTILGVAKLLGLLVVLAPGLPRLKEWAYAGLMIDVVGAFFSHLAVGHGIGDLAPPLIVLALVLASWALRPRRASPISFRLRWRPGCAGTCSRTHHCRRKSRPGRTHLMVPSWTTTSRKEPGPSLSRFTRR